jgi:protein-S-isoprenylcysteine O-methyltransferase Ste14
VSPHRLEPGDRPDVLARAFTLFALANLYLVRRPYRHVRHPQYVAFIAILFGFLLQWPTLLTLVMFPVLVTMYVRLARREETEVAAEFADVYRHYAARIRAFLITILGHGDGLQGAGAFRSDHSSP